MAGAYPSRPRIPPGHGPSWPGVPRRGSPRQPTGPLHHDGLRPLGTPAGLWTSEAFP